MRTAPIAVIEALKLIRTVTGRTIPDYRVGFTFVTEPHQYRVNFTDPRPSENNRLIELSLVHLLTIAPEELRAWQTWLDNRPGGTK